MLDVKGCRGMKYGSEKGKMERLTEAIHDWDKGNLYTFQPGCNTLG